MTDVSPVEINYFSDVLCVWAYCGDVRIEHLKKSFGERIRLHTHYFSLFGNAQGRIAEQWADKGDFPGFGEHVRDICGRWEHISAAHPALWSETRPTTSIIAHLVLKAAQLSDQTDKPTANAPTADALAQDIRLGFFENGLDISDLAILRPIAEKAGYAWPRLTKSLDDGTAHAALHADEQLKEKLQVTGSPTLVMNEGRQTIYGNVGYKVLEANVQELLSQPKEGNASWC